MTVFLHVVAAAALFAGMTALVFVAVPTVIDLIGDWRQRRAHPAKHRTGGTR
ncbi:hypothetical protein LHJ74_14430 [Streptomyces sp. N2-109]|uniref:Uncharacterized protein n=1 Tax=Streptomyces gossypii TaxID=2883101 RepID=A0ABT2JT95_9ACTN|nr:hypothetical protein [Streptomyces gossypii]MCT2591090.1 hypothetical protein [Streptomyces gossypii]